jgi:hypothetical protein
VKSKEFLFILEHKYAQSHKKNNLWFAQWNMEVRLPNANHAHT